MRSVVFRFKLDGRVRETGIRLLSRVSLGEARKLATEYRDMVRNLIGPILARREQRRRRLLKSRRVPTWHSVRRPKRLSICRNLIGDTASIYSNGATHSARTHIR